MQNKLALSTSTSSSTVPLLAAASSAEGSAERSCDRKSQALAVSSVATLAAVFGLLYCGGTLGCVVGGTVTEISGEYNRKMNLWHDNPLSFFGNNFVFAAGTSGSYTGLCIDPAAGKTLDSFVVPNKGECNTQRVRAQNGFFSVVDTNVTICGVVIYFPDEVERGNSSDTNSTTNSLRGFR